MNSSSMKKPNRRRLQDDKGRLKRPMQLSGRGLKRTLSRHIQRSKKPRGGGF